MLKIVRVKHDSKGMITHYQLNNGDIVSKEDTIQMVKDGKISGVLAGVNENGARDINLLSGANQTDHVDKLPEITGNMEFVIRDIYNPSETRYPDKNK